MTDEAARLARDIADLQRRVRAMERSSQLENSSVQVNGEAVRLPSAIKTGLDGAAQATVALETANGKNTVIYAMTYAPGSDDLPEETPDPNQKEGDLWWTRSVIGDVLRMYIFRNGRWETATLTDTVIAYVTAAKIITGQLQVGTEIYAGDPNGTHARLTGTGLYIYAADEVDGEPNQVIRLGSDQDDYFGIIDEAGNLRATIDAGGVGNFTGLNVTEDPVFQGRRLSEIVGSSGIFRGGYQQTLGANYGPIQTSVGLVEASANLQTGHAYEVSWRCTWYSESVPFEAIFMIRSTNAPEFDPDNCPTPTRTSRQEDIWFRSAAPSAGEWITESGTTIIYPNFNSRHRFLLTIERGNVGVNSCWVVGNQKVALHIRDLGAIAGTGSGARNNGGGNLYQQPAPPPPVVVQDYFMDVQAGWSSTYRGDGSLRTDTSDVIQGQTSTNGSQFGYWGWGDRLNPALGSTITRMSLYLYSNHWYYNSGGTAVLNLAGNNGPGFPFRVGGKADWYVSGFPKPGGQWVDLPADWWPLFANGTARGITLGQAPTAAGYYGRFNGANTGAGYAPGLRIWYRK